MYVKSFLEDQSFFFNKIYIVVFKALEEKKLCLERKKKKGEGGKFGENEKPFCLCLYKYDS